MANTVLPPSVLANLEEVQSAMEALEQELETVLPRCRGDVLVHLNPVDRATTFLQIARTAGSLFSCKLALFQRMQDQSVCQFCTKNCISRFDSVSKDKRYITRRPPSQNRTGEYLHLP